MTTKWAMTRRFSCANGRGQIEEMVSSQGPIWSAKVYLPCREGSPDDMGLFVDIQAAKSAVEKRLTESGIML